MKLMQDLSLNKKLGEKFSEAFSSVLPITVIVLILSITFVPLEPGPVVLFMFGALLLILGMALFTLGVDMSMMPMGDGIGSSMAKAKHRLIPVVLCLILGILVTIAEPDLTVLATQLTGISNMTIILSVAIGVGVFMVLSLLRTALKIPLSYTLIFFYGVVFALTAVVAVYNPDFIPVSFDSGGVTTGPITVPFIMALGIGLASLGGSKGSQSDSFGMVAMCSIGPILAVLILGIVQKDVTIVPETTPVPDIVTVKDAAVEFLTKSPAYFKEVVIALAPIALMFLLFELVTTRFKKHQLIRIIAGFVYTYLGLVLFLTGVNVGFMPVGHLIGVKLAGSAYKWLLIPVGMVVGYFIVAAEPAVHVLKKQVEEVSNGSISQRSMGIALSVGVCASVGIAMLRILTGISILWFLIPGYAIALGMSFFVPQIYTGVAFDAGGVASGPMTATFLLPLAMGACTALGGNILSDAFGIVAMVAMTPLVTIQLLGFYAVVKKKIAGRNYENVLGKTDDCVVYFD